MEITILTGQSSISMVMLDYWRVAGIKNHHGYPLVI